MAQRKPQTEKSKATRARSWLKNQEAKKERIAENDARHAANLMLGTNSKQRKSAAYRAANPKE